MASKISGYVSFNFKKFSPQQPNITFKGDAVATPEGKLQLTKADGRGEPVRNSFGGAYHISPVQIWDSSDISNAASFFTCFSFSIYAEEIEKTPDSLAFLLAPVNMGPQSWGENLGLLDQGRAVAIEFDNYKHKVFIRIGETKVEAPWEFENGEEAFVYISYDDTFSFLKATCVYPKSGKLYPVKLPGANLRNVLPADQWVNVGFCACNANRETVEVNSWYFASAFEDYPLTLADPLWKRNPRLASEMRRHFDSN